MLGSVGPATEEALANAGDAASQVDEIGLSGLQYAYQEQLAGTASGRMVLLDRESGQELEVLGEIAGTSGTPLTTSLDLGVQTAAEEALAEVPTPAAIVAVDADSGADPRRREWAGSRRWGRPRPGRPIPPRLDVQGRHDRSIGCRRPGSLRRPWPARPR